MSDSLFDQRIQQLVVGDGTTAYRVTGSGPGLLLVHGYPQPHVCWCENSAVNTSL